MNSLISSCFLGLGLFVSIPDHAQLPSNRIRPGTMYYAGDTVHSPRLGLHAQIPDGWEGVIPGDAEVFLLMPASNVNGEIYVAANEHLDRQGQINKWKAGMELDGGMHLMPSGEIIQRGDVICVEGKVTGNRANAAPKIYLEARCSPFGFCLSYMLITDPASYETVKKALQSFVDHTSFSRPTNESPYLHFNWKKFFSGKVLLMIDYEKSSKREDEVNFCSDGTFTSSITRRGLFKEQAKQYQGRKKGTWAVRNEGERAILTFSIEKLPPIDVTIEARDEDIYVNGNRYFIGNSEKCK